MGKSKDVNSEKISEISALLEHSNHSQRKIAFLTSVNVMTVNRIKAKLDRKIPLGSQRTGKCGRKRITTPRDERKIRDICLGNRRKCTKELTKIVNDAGINISGRTTRRRLVEMGFKCCRPAKKPKLTPVMKFKRLAWAKQHRHLTVEDWENVNINFFILHFVVLYQTTIWLVIFDSLMLH
jgi:transposase